VGLLACFLWAPGMAAALNEETCESESATSRPSRQEAFDQKDFRPHQAGMTLLQTESRQQLNASSAAGGPCEQFFVGHCQFAGHLWESINRWHSFEAAFMLCCLGGGHLEATCKQVKKEALDFKTPRDQLHDDDTCQEMLSLYEAHKHWENDIAKSSSSSALVATGATRKQAVNKTGLAEHVVSLMANFQDTAP
jgi:hypothetical protein